MLAERINGVYLPRNPKASPLHGLLEDDFDEFEHVYDVALPINMASGGQLSARSSIDSRVAATCGNTFASMVVSWDSCVLVPMPAIREMMQAITGDPCPLYDENHLLYRRPGGGLQDSQPFIPLFTRSAKIFS
jgi:hypothetical protein